MRIIYDDKCEERGPKGAPLTNTHSHRYYVLSDNIGGERYNTWRFNRPLTI